MKQLLIILASYLFLNTANAQNGFGIGTTAPNANAILDITSPNRSLLLPRVHDTMALNNNNLGTNVAGMIAYDSAQGAIVWSDGLKWRLVNEIISNVSAYAQVTDTFQYDVGDTFPIPGVRVVLPETGTYLVLVRYAYTQGELVHFSHIALVDGKVTDSYEFFLTGRGEDGFFRGNSTLMTNGKKGQVFTLSFYSKPRSAPPHYYSLSLYNRGYFPRNSIRLIRISGL